MTKAQKNVIQRMLIVICFIGIGVFLHNQIFRVIRVKTRKTANYIDSFYEVPRDKTDILILGSSHAFCSIQPNELWGDYGYSSYVFGSPAQSIPCSYYLLKEALAHQKPKVVVLEVLYIWLDSLYLSSGSLRHVTDGMRMGKAKLEMLQDFLKNMDWKEKASYYLPFIKYHSRWNDLKSYDFHWNRWLLGGSSVSTIKKQSHPPAAKTKSELPANAVQYLEKITRLCEENDIQLILFAAPQALAKKNKTNNIPTFFLTLEDYAGEKEIPFLFEQKNELAGIDYTHDFRDSTHLNIYGAKKVTQMLGEYLKDNYPQVDHRGDPGYSYWEKCYQSYMEYLVKNKISL